MDDGEPQQRPARLGVGRDAADLLLGHAGIVLELQRGEGASLVAAKPREGDDGADIGAPGCQPLGLPARIKILPLDADRRHLHPPVIGGKKAISPAPAIAASGLTCRRSMAARTTLGFSKACAYS